MIDYTLDRWITDTAERVAATFLAGILVWLAAAPTLGVSWFEALVAATVPPCIVIVMQMIPSLSYHGQVWWVDAAVRTLRSVVQAAGAVLVVEGADLFEVETWQSAGIAAGYAVLATLKAIAARRVPDTVTPASLATI